MAQDNDVLGETKVQEAPDVPVSQKWADGKKNLKERNYDTAADYFCSALRDLVATFGDLALECAEAYYMYGHAMLSKVENEKNILGDAIGKTESDDEGDGDEEEDSENEKEGSENDGEDPAEKKSASAEVTGKGKGKAHDSKTEEATAAEQRDDDASDGTAGQGEGVDDLHVVWENLDTARVIWSKYENQKWNLARVHLRLSDHCLESEQFEGAVKECEASIAIREEILPSYDKRLADAYFQLCLAYQYSDRFDDAIKSCQRAIAVFSQCISRFERALIEGPAILDEMRAATTSSATTGASSSFSSSSSGGPTVASVGPATTAGKWYPVADAYEPPSTPEAIQEQIEDMKAILESLREKEQDLRTEKAEPSYRENAGKALADLLNTSSGAGAGSNGLPAHLAEILVSKLGQVVAGTGGDTAGAGAAGGGGDGVVNLGVVGRGTKRIRIGTEAPTAAPAPAEALSNGRPEGGDAGVKKPKTDEKSPAPES